MTISEECKAAMVENGVLMKDGQPAGVVLMQKDTLRVAFIQKNENGGGVKPDSLSPDLIEYLNLTGRLNLLFQIDRPQGDYDIKTAFVEGVSYWYDGAVEFVSPHEKPDLQVMLFAGGMDMPYGFSSFPSNDHPDAYPYNGDSAIMGINVLRAENPDFFYESLLGKGAKSEYSGETTQEVVTKIVRHEFGHNLGILHPEQALRYSVKEDPKVCDVKGALTELANGIMSEGDNSDGSQNIPSDDTVFSYDTVTRDFIRNF